MSTVLSVRPEEPKIKRLNWNGRIIAAASFALLLCIVAVVYFMFESQREEAWLTNDVSLSVVTVLTADDPVYMSVPTRVQIFSYLPDWVKEKTYKWFDLGGSVKHETDARPGQIEPLIRVNFPSKWHSQFDHQEISDHLNTARIDGNKHLFARLNYGNGFYSSERPVNFAAITAPPNSKFFLFDLAFNVPANCDNPVLEFFWPGGETLAELPIHNPLPPVEPLSVKTSGPVTARQGNVELVLRHFISRSSGRIDSQASLEEREQAVERGLFRPVPVAKTHQPSTVAVFEIRQVGRAIDKWSINDITVHYGKKRLPFGPENVDVSQVGRYQVVKIIEDIGALMQPVELGVKLLKQKELAADEVQRLELPIPAEKSTGMPVHKVTFWNGTTTVWLENKSSDPEPGLVSPFDLTVIATRLADDGVIKPGSVHLLLEDGTDLDLAPYKMHTQNHDIGWGYVYDMDRAIASTNISPGRSDKASTLILELVSPRRLDNMKLIAEPTSAAVLQ